MSNCFVIGITGGSGSGKTSFIKELRQRFSEEELCILSQDDYYKDRELQYVDENGIKNFDRLDSIDMNLMYEDVLKLTQGKEIHKKEYVFNNELANARDLIFKPAPILVIEGLFVFSEKKIRDLFNFTVFIHADDSIKVIRRIKRDRTERNYPLEDVLYRYENHVLPAYKAYIEPFKDKVNLVVNNNKNYDVGLKTLSSFIREKLKNC